MAKELIAPAPFKDEREKSVKMDDELQHVVNYIKKCKEPKKLDFIREMIYAHEAELRAEKMLKDKPKNKLTDKPMEYEDDEV